jgi:predicted enzyme related to lactoylglutathione lyase
MSNKHAIIHVEFSSKDLAGSMKFYNKVFGWKTENYPDMNYSTFEAEGGPGGGFNPVHADYPAGRTMVYISTPELVAT